MRWHNYRLQCAAAGFVRLLQTGNLLRVQKLKSDTVVVAFLPAFAHFSTVTQWRRPCCNLAATIFSRQKRGCVRHGAAFLHGLCPSARQQRWKLPPRLRFRQAPVRTLQLRRCVVL